MNIIITAILNNYNFSHSVTSHLGCITKILLIFAGLLPVVYWIISRNPFRIRLTRVFVLGGIYLILAILFIILVRFNPAQLNYQGVFFLNGFSFFNAPIMFGYDGISLAFVILTLIILPYCVISTWDLRNSNNCTVLVLIINFFLILTFSVIDLFWFYFFFEATLLPILVLIGVWGSHKRRQKALLYFIIYAMFGSFLIIWALSIYYVEFGTTNYIYLYKISFGYKDNIPLMPIYKQIYIWLPIFVSFATKVPIIPFTLWLPEAHVEAPTVGSIILAAILLKVGGYGITKFLYLMQHAQQFFQPFTLWVCTLSIVYAAVAAIGQVDIKRLVAYSSIVHINIALAGVFSLSKFGGVGGLMIIFSHGIVSAALFYLIGVLYNRFSNRLFGYYGGLSTIIPIFSVYFFLFILSNISFPLTSGFIGEVFVIVGLVKKKLWLVLSLVIVTLFLNTFYSLILLQKILYSNYPYFLDDVSDLTETESTVLLHLIIYNIGFSLFPRYLISLFKPFFSCLSLMTRDNSISSSGMWGL